MREKIFAGNWKMNMTITEARTFLRNLLNLIGKENFSGKQIIIFPTSAILGLFRLTLGDTIIKYGAQNIHQETKGAYTGEVSGPILKSMGCSHVIVGHSERRQYFGESNELLAKKVLAALQADLIPVYCCGETLEEREKEKHFDIIKAQIETSLFNLAEMDFLKIIIAYEPVWAIGTGKVATPEQAQEIHFFIRGLIERKYGKVIAEKSLILYGGSVKSSNSRELFTQPDIDGGLIGGASLDAGEFYSIITSV